MTTAPLKIAEKMRSERGLTNVSFELGDAERGWVMRRRVRYRGVPLRDSSLRRARKAIGEMERVCRLGGTVAVEDLIASEERDRAAYYNEFEQLRDTSHTKALAMSELIAMMGRPGSK